MFLEYSFEPLPKHLPLRPEALDPAAASQAQRPQRALLAASTLDYGRYRGQIVAPLLPHTRPETLPIVLLIHGAGGFNIAKKNKKILPTNCPFPCWYAYMEIPGTYKQQIPPEFIYFLKDIYDMSRPNSNTIIAYGLSRGGRWLEEIVREQPEVDSNPFEPSAPRDM